MLKSSIVICIMNRGTSLNTGEEVSIDKQVACEECPRWLKMTEVACEEISCRYIFCILIEIGSFHGY